MPSIDIILNGDNAWPDLAKKREQGKVVHLADSVWGLAVLPRGMQSGKTSVALRVDLPDGRVMVAEMSLRALDAALRTIKARYKE